AVPPRPVRGGRGEAGRRRPRRVRGAPGLLNPDPLMWSHQSSSPGETSMHPDDHYVVISADCHGGGEIHEYRDFLASQYHDEFDAWVAAYQIPFGDLLGDLGKRNWDSDRRTRDLEADGIVGEVMFPNTVPPFFPGGALVTQIPPTDPHD